MDAVRPYDLFQTNLLEEAAINDIIDDSITHKVYNGRVNEGAVAITSNDDHVQLNARSFVGVIVFPFLMLISRLFKNTLLPSGLIFLFLIMQPFAVYANVDASDDHAVKELWNTKCESPLKPYPSNGSVCEWTEFVTCASVSGVERVTSIELSDLCGVPDSIGTLSELSHLTLSYGKLIRLPDSLGNLSSMTDLTLSSNQLTSLPDSLEKLKALNFLDISSNQLTVLPASFSNLESLIYLTASSNQLSSLPESLGDLSMLSMVDVSGNQLVSLPESLGDLKALQILYFSSNQLSSLPESLGDLSMLTTLDVSGNQLSSLPESLGNLKALEILDVSSNQLSSLPESLGDLSMLTNLHVSENQLVSLPESLGNLKALEILEVSSNQLSSLPDSLLNLSSLTILDVSSNQLISLPESLGDLELLNTLLIRLNHLNSLPVSLGDLKALTHLDASFNELSSLPDSLGNLKVLEDLIVTCNQLKSLPESLGNLRALDSLHLYSNQLTSLPDSLWNLTQLKQLDVSFNHLKSISVSLGNLKSLTDLEISSNQLTFIPQSLGDLKALSSLNINSNQLSSLPESVGDLKALGFLTVFSNQLKSLPESFENLKELKYLDISLNQLTVLPASLFNLKLSYLDVSANQLTSLPQLGDLKALNFLNLDSNQLTSLPSLRNMTQLVDLKACANQLTSLPESLEDLKALKNLVVCSNQLKSLPDSLWNLTTLTNLDVSSNQLTRLSDSLGNLKALKSLFVGSNELTSIPSTLGMLTSLETLHASNTRLKSLPLSIGNLPKLRILMLASNELTSLPIPMFSLTEIQQLDVSYNQLMYSVVDFIFNVRKMPRLAVLSISSAMKIHKGVHYSPDMKDAPPSLITLDISGNGIDGQINAHGSLVNVIASTISTLDISDNQISGTLGIMPQIHSLRVQNNPNIHSTTTKFSEMVKFNPNILIHNDDGNYACQGLAGRYTHMDIQMDPSYYGYEGCYCKLGSYGVPSTSCKICPSFSPDDTASCIEGKIQLAPGWWIHGIVKDNETIGDPILVSNDTIKLERCPSTSVYTSDCLGTSADGVFHCKEGSDDRFCSACKPTYHKTQLSCVKCAPQAVWATLLAFGFGAIALFGLFAIKQPSTGASVKVLIFYSQALVLLFTRVSLFHESLWSAIGDVVRGALGMTSGTSMLGWDCLVQDWPSATDRYLFKFSVMALMPLLVVVLVPLVFWIHYFVMCWMKRRPKRPLVTHMILYLLFFLYMPVSSVFVRALGVDQYGFMIDAPWISTSDYAWSSVMNPIGIIGFVLFVCLLPLYVVIRLILHNHYQPGKPLPSSLEFVAGGYRPKLPWFEGVMLLRRLVLVLGVSLFPFQSAWVPTIVLSTVIGMLVLEILVLPFANDNDYRRDIMSLVTINLSYTTGILTGSGLIEEESAEHVCLAVLALNIVTLIVLMWAVVVPLLKQGKNLVQTSAGTVSNWLPIRGREVEIGLQESHLADGLREQLLEIDRR